ncbi:hypothetical protein [Amycolatopsis sp. GM8]|uniref:hypothetical protein n=1 Tax=Amycolatopsis sp. GM8 TaxID=2896530 RepID=UPI001F29A259|nr:hypothetical protein [Amycolatopsis sp. GM8]
MADDGDGALPQLGRLETLPLRDVWLHEAQDFTPWPLTNTDALGEAHAALDWLNARTLVPAGGATQ